MHPTVQVPLLPPANLVLHEVHIEPDWLLYIMMLAFNSNLDVSIESLSSLFSKSV